MEPIFWTVKQTFWWPTLSSFSLWPNPNLLRVHDSCKCNRSSLKQKRNLSTDSDGFWLSQAQGRSQNNIFSWGSRKHFLTFWSSLSFFLELLLNLGAWRGSNTLTVFHVFQWDNIWPWKAGRSIFFPLYFFKLYLTNKNQDLWPSSCISKYKHNKNECILIRQNHRTTKTPMRTEVRQLSL